MFYAPKNQTSDIGAKYLNWVGNNIDLIYICSARRSFKKINVLAAETPVYSVCTS